MSSFDLLADTSAPFAFKPYVPPPPEEEPENICAYALKFREWAEAHVRTIMQSPSIETINQGKVHLLDKYYEWRALLPTDHRSVTGTQGEHICILSILDEAYKALAATALALRPAPLYLPAPKRKPKEPAPPTPPTYGIALLGEVE